jgi:flavin reductase (DIM6/NTAB) family NADH-FMN oxidoreductase RutF
MEFRMNIFNKEKAGAVSNVFDMIGKQWMLITSGDAEVRFNTMTASWGGMGVLWNKNVCFCFIRPSRYTYEFMENGDTFTLSFFGETHRQALAVCGKYSGRQHNKTEMAGLTVRNFDGCAGFDEAETVIVCKKIYFADFDPRNFLDKSIESNYSGKDYHRCYIGEILNVYKKA